MNKTFATLAGAVVATVIASSAQAAVVYPGTSWGTIPGENSGGGSSTITTTAPHDGGGSIEMFGDRTRYSMGNYYDPSSNLGLLNTVLGISFDWRVAGNSSGGYSPDLTPALRIHIRDGNVRSELIWEGAYNGTYGNTQKDTWYTTTFKDLFYQNVNLVGVTKDSSGQQINQTVQAWEAAYSPTAYVTAISVGVGSGFSSTYHAFADDVIFATTAGSTTYNFETLAAAVPEPASMALLAMGLVGAGVIRRRK